ncbi:MAG: OmpH family outer membrane protein [Neisseriaceae bacterium]|nr:OmpH family outer membrane protein [Neisseriaceae bacterium]MBP6862850.1 OmpH family outer membrane protein [Neisseriaceae bacterium]
MRILQKMMAAGVALTLMQGVYAQGVQKLGFISTERVYQEAKAAQSIVNRLDKEFAAQQNTLKALRAEGVKIEKKLGSSQLSAAERIKTEDEYKSLIASYNETSAIVSREYTLRRNEEFASIQEQANNIIRSIAKQQGYDLILQEAVYVDPKYDITDQVIKTLDRQ